MGTQNFPLPHHLDKTKNSFVDNDLNKPVTDKVSMTTPAPVQSLILLLLRHSILFTDKCLKDPVSRACVRLLCIYQ